MLPQQKPVPFNLVAYQNALNARQKLLAEASNVENNNPQSSIYVSQNVHKKTKKQKNTASRGSTRQQQDTQKQYDYHQQNAPQQTYTPEPAPLRYQPAVKNIYSKTDNIYTGDSPLFYNDPRQVEYQPQAPVRTPKVPKQRTTQPPKRKHTYETDESIEEYPENKFQAEPKYATEDLPYEYQTNDKYVDESVYRQPASKLPKQQKYENRQIDVKDDYAYASLPKYQEKKTSSSVVGAEVRPARYFNRPQHYQEETRQFPQYQLADQIYQQTVNVPVKEEGPRASYRQDLKSSNVRFYRKLGESESSLE